MSTPAAPGIAKGLLVVGATVAAAPWPPSPPGRKRQALIGRAGPGDLLISWRWGRLKVGDGRLSTWGRGNRNHRPHPVRAGEGDPCDTSHVHALRG
jgi:hypothetical protein